MNVHAKAIWTLYRVKRITVECVRTAVKDGLITAEDFMKITGVKYE